MRTKKKIPKRNVKRLVSTVSKRREISQDKKLKAMVLKMIKDDSKLHNCGSLRVCYPIQPIRCCFHLSTFVFTATTISH